MRRVQASVLALCFVVICLHNASNTFAQRPFTQLDWNELRIDSLLPVYSEVVPLESDYRLYNYEVRVSYPEWKALTSAETAVVERFAQDVSDSLRIFSEVGVSRRQGMLDIGFIPIVRNANGTYSKLISCKIEILPHRRSMRRAGEQITTQQRWSTSSVLASGQWAKISITDDGLYHLTNSALKKMGFSHPSRIRVYGYGGHPQSEKMDADADWDDLQPVALMPVSDGFVFYGNGLSTWQNGHNVVNHYARAAYYFITEADTDASALAEVANTTADDAQIVTSFAAYTGYNPQEYAWYQGGRQLYENYDYANGNAKNYTLSLPTYATDDAARLTVAMTAANDTQTEVIPSYNGTTLPSAKCSALGNYLFATEVVRNFSVDAPLASNTVRITTTKGNHARLNYIELAYTGLLKIDVSIPSIAFSYKANDEAEKLRIEYESGQAPRLWRLDEPGSPAVSLKGKVIDEKDGNGALHHYFDVPVNADGIEHRYVAFDANAYASFGQPESSGTIENQNLHALDSIDMVIITPASGLLDAQAQRLAELHRATDGLKVFVVRADIIYNEFSSGTPDATAYRRFMKMLYDRAEDVNSAPRYLLLFGDCAWDNRMLTTAWRGYDPDNFLLCFESVNSFSDTQCYVMEDYFGLLDDGEGGNLTNEKVDIGVGRFPVRSVAEARALVDKTIAYVQGSQAGAWKNIVSFLGDDGDNNEHLLYADQVADWLSELYPHLEIRKVMWDAYKRQSTTTGNRYPQVEQIVKAQMEEGALMMNYTGHGAPYCLSHEQVLRTEDFARFSTPRPPLWVTAACDIMPFDTQKDNIGETAILHETGSAIAFYGTTRTVYAHLNKPMNQAFCRALFGTDEFGRANRLGDAVRIAKVQLVDGDGNVIRRESSNTQNKLHYALLGDPALRIGAQTNRIVLDSINGVAVEQLPAGFTLHAGCQARFAGHLKGADGNLMNGFSGTLTARLYDSESKVTCLNNAGASSAFTFSAYDKILYSGTDSVRSGRFVITCPVPLDINYSDEEGRMMFYAISNDLRSEANGYSQDFLIGGTEPALNDTSGPDITAFLGSDSFADGDEVGATPYFVATLKDQSGINTSGNGIGHNLELIIDNNAQTTYTLNDYFTNEFGDYSCGHVAFSIPTLAAGAHTLLFRAWDMLNNSSTKIINFNVSPSLKANILSLSATSNPATTQTSFVLSYDRPGSLCTFRVEVFDFVGRLLWTHTETGSNAKGIYTIPWNLTTGSGMPLGSGVYLYRAHLWCDESDEVTKAQKIIINRRK